MKTALLCDYDTVLEMEEMGIGFPEILQYVRGVLSARDVSVLLLRLERMLSDDLQEDPLLSEAESSRGEVAAA